MVVAAWAAAAALWASAADLALAARGGLLLGLFDRGLRNLLGQLALDLTQRRLGGCGFLLVGEGERLRLGCLGLRLGGE